MAKAKVRPSVWLVEAICFFKVLHCLIFATYINQTSPLHAWCWSLSTPSESGLLVPTFEELHYGVAYGGFGVMMQMVDTPKI